MFLPKYMVSDIYTFVRGRMLKIKYGARAL